MVAPDDKVVGSIVAANQGMPQCLARSGHTHGQRQQREEYSFRIIVAVGQSLVGTNAGVVIHIPGFGHADDRM